MSLKRGLLKAGIFFALMAAALAAAKPVNDDFINDTVRQKLASDSVVKGGAIEVDVHDGVVTLKGRVEEQRQKVKAEKIAKKVGGVKQVVNQIQLSRP